MDIDELPKVMGDDGQFHAADEAVDLSHTTLEDWVALAIFWVLGGHRLLPVLHALRAERLGRRGPRRSRATC